MGLDHGQKANSVESCEVQAVSNGAAAEAVGGRLGSDCGDKVQHIDRGGKKRGGKGDRRNKATSKYQTVNQAVKIKRLIRERDGYKCTECGMTNEEHKSRYGKSLDVHRKTPGSTYAFSNSVTLCKKCHGPKEKGKWTDASQIFANRWNQKQLNCRIDSAIFECLVAFCESRGEEMHKVIDLAIRRHIDSPPPQIQLPPLPPITVKKS